MRKELADLASGLVRSFEFGGSQCHVHQTTEVPERQTAILERKRRVDSRFHVRCRLIEEPSIESQVTGHEITQYVDVGRMLISGLGQQTVCLGEPAATTGNVCFDQVGAGDRSAMPHLGPEGTGLRC